ncbi:MAG: hypothetical protein OES57_08850 [Acidimicrobiia bacterium]|nr:hypothetical protein [Acidimicrobiia bacterium]
MSRRLEVELTSVRDDGRWTWRAAGAKQPKGELDAALLFDGASVGDVVKVEAEFFIDGISVTQVFPPKEKARKEPDRLELLGSRGDEAGVTTQLVGKKGRRGRDRDDDRGRGRRDRKERAGSRRDGRDRDRGDKKRRERQAAPPRPKVPRLKAGRAHRKAALDALPEVQRPIAEQLLRGGIPAVRQAVAKQNETAKAEGKPLIQADALVGLAEQIYPALRTAEWHDRADAALAGIDDVDLRDLRSVVVAADAAARDDETRALATELKDALARRVEAEHTGWLNEIAATLADGRTVRALRLSSRPPKAGAPLPADLAGRLAVTAGEGLAADTSHDRYATVLDAVAFSPVRTMVTPAAVPDNPSTDLTEAVTRLSSRIPEIARLFGIEPTEARRSGRKRSSGRKPIPPPPDATAGAAPPSSAVPADQDAPTDPAPGESGPEPAESAAAPVASEAAPPSSAAPADQGAPADPAPGESGPEPAESAAAPVTSEAAPPSSAAPTDSEQAEEASGT